MMELYTSSLRGVFVFELVFRAKTLEEKGNEREREGLPRSPISQFSEVFICSANSRPSQMARLVRVEL